MGEILEPQLVSEMIKATAIGLCKSWEFTLDASKTGNLFFPERRNKDFRISEQESKLLMAQWMGQNGLSYSVETPTRKTYRQSGSQDLSARSDLTVWTRTLQEEYRLLNVELKAGNPKTENFRKDLEKLLREGVNGLWFHTLQNANRGTLPSIFSKINDSFHQLDEFLGLHSQVLYFAFCIIKCYYGTISKSGRCQARWVHEKGFVVRSAGCLNRT